MYPFLRPLIFITALEYLWNNSFCDIPSQTDNIFHRNVYCLDLDMPLRLGQWRKESAKSGHERQEVSRVPGVPGSLYFQHMNSRARCRALHADAIGKENTGGANAISIIYD